MAARPLELYPEPLRNERLRNEREDRSRPWCKATQDADAARPRMGKEKEHPYRCDGSVPRRVRVQVDGTPVNGEDFWHTMRLSWDSMIHLSALPVASVTSAFLFATSILPSTELAPSAFAITPCGLPLHFPPEQIFSGKVTAKTGDLRIVLAGMRATTIFRNMRGAMKKHHLRAPESAAAENGATASANAENRELKRDEDDLLGKGRILPHDLDAERASWACVDVQDGV
ncbi:uncharacterized protein B0H18DRAFT_1121985 [Fomitopsis serialis]|uniref:uncharacterized protein n=1 Tax=Fomitopsis serialis TaxID=139415 RepID=UPI00200859DB|nr:uncharacterized protein B0H18DRAFT_1121985 [Neoantrodia serialis]KAH9920391.1 hypothetical protein B0H18DRAFT_1121985 [Neoantrodia serialis]